MIKLKPLITEAGKIDRAYVKKSFSKFKKLDDPSDKDWKNLVTSVIKDLGGKPTTRNVDDMEQHLHMVYSDEHEFPRTFPDATDFKEMYDVIK